MAQDDLKQQIVSFLEGYSIEATPHDAEKLPSFPEVIPAGTSVYMAHPPGVPLNDIVRLAVQLQQLGFNAVPHIISRKLESRDALERALADLSAAGITQALVLGGDEAVPDNPFDSSLEVLRTGLFSQYGFKAVGVAGHPEGSQAIGAERVAEALHGKSEFSKTADFDMRLVTQFGFEPEAVTDWENRTSTSGVTLPIHAGMAGPASVRQLIRFAVLCGIGTSAKLALARSGATANLLRTQAPDGIITHFARHRTENASARIEKAHFFCFGGVLKTAKWANAVIAGQFEMNSKADGFDVK